MPTAEKAVKERDYIHKCLWQRKKEQTTNACAKEGRNRPLMPVAKKERPNHKCWCQMKNGCPNQASKQLTPNERNKTAETTSKPQTVAYLQA